MTYTLELGPRLTVVLIVVVLAWTLGAWWSFADPRRR
jgi:hypothetical protein